MTEPRTNCRVCDVSILQRTADRFGMCRRCYDPNEDRGTDSHYFYHIPPWAIWRPNELSFELNSVGVRATATNDHVQAVIPVLARQHAQVGEVDATIRQHPNVSVKNVTVKYDRETLNNLNGHPNPETIKSAFQKCGYFAGNLTEFFAKYIPDSTQASLIRSKLNEMVLHERHYLDKSNLESFFKNRNTQNSLVESIGPLLKTQGFA